jgi:Ca2+-binding RTX toxin-like protein
MERTKKGKVAGVLAAAALAAVGSLIVVRPANALTCTINGTDASETIYGTSGNDVICGFGGDDVIDGLGGNDTLYGHGGNDRLWGYYGNDTLVGGPGNDAMWGEAGDDSFWEGDTAGGDADTMRGGAGVDMVSYAGRTAGVEAAIRYGTNCDARGACDGWVDATGQSEQDRYYELESLVGGSGNDTLYGGYGLNKIWGLAGNDSIELGDCAGGDWATGGDGIDAVSFDGGDSYANDFEGVRRHPSCVQ